MHLWSAEARLARCRQLFRQAIYRVGDQCGAMVDAWETFEQDVGSVGDADAAAGRWARRRKELAEAAARAPPPTAKAAAKREDRSQAKDRAKDRAKDKAKEKGKGKGKRSRDEDDAPSGAAARGAARAGADAGAHANGAGSSAAADGGVARAEQQDDAGSDANPRPVKKSRREEESASCRGGRGQGAVR